MSHAPEKKKTMAGRKAKGLYVEVSPPPMPLQDDQKIKCQEATCKSLFSSQGALKTHFRKVHPTGNYVAPPKNVDPDTGREGVEKKRVDKVRNGL
jgi:hypothetical protein